MIAMIIEPITLQLKGLRIISTIRTTSKTCSSYIVLTSSEIVIPLPGAQTKTHGVCIVNGGQVPLVGPLRNNLPRPQKLHRETYGIN